MKLDASAVDKLKFMGRPPDHPWWKTGSPESFLGCPKYFDLSLKHIFLVINTNFACFQFNNVPTYRELGRPSGDIGGHVGSPDRVMGRIWRLGDVLSTALRCFTTHTMRPTQRTENNVNRKTLRWFMIQDGTTSAPPYMCDSCTQCGCWHISAVSRTWAFTSRGPLH